MPYRIKFASTRAVEQHGELADDADIWVRGFRASNPFETVTEAWGFCADEDADSDGLLTHRPYEVSDDGD